MQTGSVVVTSRGEEYRRRAQACLDAAHIAQNEQARAALLRLSEDWLRMAKSWDDAAPAATVVPAPHSHLNFPDPTRWRPR